MRTKRGAAGAALCAAMAGLGLIAPAEAAIGPTRDAEAVARAIVKDLSTLRGATFVTLPPAGCDPAVDPGCDEPEAEGPCVEDPDDPACDPGLGRRQQRATPRAAVASSSPVGLLDGASPLTAFPLEGSTDSAIFTTGDPMLADDPNDDEGTGVDLGGESPEGRGDTAFDVTTLKLDLTAPQGTNCVTVSFRFASDEFPEFVGSDFNDAFIAELGQSTWSTSASEIRAPDNFAFDQIGNVISVNATGAETVAPEDAAGSTYDAATQLLVASKPVIPGELSLFLSIFDQGDKIYDSAALVDNVVFSDQKPELCAPGAIVDEADPPTVVPAAELPAVTKDGIVTLTVSDGPRGSGAKNLRYRLNGGAEQAQPVDQGKVTLTLPEGRNALEYWGEDRRGNQGPHQTANIAVDRTAPVIGITSDQGKTTYLEGEEGSITVAASDEVSGLAINPSAKVPLDTSTPGPKALSFAASDLAGNAVTAPFAWTVKKVNPGSLVSAPGTKRCVNRRRGIRVTPGRLKAIKIVRTSIKVGSAKQRTYSGKSATRRRTLKPSGRSKKVPVRITMTTSTGKRFVLNRTYRRC